MNGMTTTALTYDQALAYLAQFINYETQQRVAYDPEHFNPDSFAGFLQTLGSPHEAFPSVLIAGSKGKGSTSVMVAAILGQSGLRTGLFVKPHLVTIRERTQIGRQLISHEAFAALVSELRDHLAVSGQPQNARFRTFFELTTALSFLHFMRQHVDIAVVEVGLGGRLDTTNVLTPRVAVLTPIGLEHTHILGDTLPAIAREKAGIIKPHSCVVSAAQAPEVVAVFEQRCQEQQATLWLAGRDFQWQVSESSCDGNRLDFDGCGLCLTDLHVPLLGRHQAANAAVALAVIAQLQKQGWSVTDDHIRQGLATVQWEGRLEVVDREPWVIFDAAFTPESAQSLRQALDELFPYQRLYLVLGMSADKNIAAVVAILAPLAHEVFATHFNNPRACDPQRLAGEVRRHHNAVQVVSDPLDALHLARQRAYPSDLICVAGSLFLLGEIKARQQGVPLEF
jgi:dihydrofolate synthase/folylpolyglutamate synthase